MVVKKRKFKRRVEGKTDYKKRYQLLLSNKPRLVIRITNTRIICQIVEYKDYKDETVTMFTSDSLKKHKWTYTHKNIPCSYLTGYACAKQAMGKKIKEAIVDIGLHKVQKKGRLFSCVKGAIDGGLKINADESMFPDNDKIKGVFIKKEKLFSTVFENIKKI